MLGAHPEGVQGVLRAEGVPGAGATVQNLIAQTWALWCWAELSPLQSCTTMCPEETLQVFATG